MCSSRVAFALLPCSDNELLLTGVASQNTQVASLSPPFPACLQPHVAAVGTSLQATPAGPFPATVTQASAVTITAMSNVTLNYTMYTTGYTAGGECISVPAAYVQAGTPI